jgi:hypothetical protein
VGTSSFSKTFILPTISTNPGRLLIFKDIYGSFSTSSVYLSTTGLDGFENNGSTMRLATNYGAWTFLNDAVTRWYLVDSYKNTMLVSTNTSISYSYSGTISATGGTITVTSQYKYHAFTTSGSFVISSGTGTVNYLIVGGGGGGGDRHGGGGGAGGVVSGTWSASPGTYTVTVGAGGTHGATTEGGQTQYGSPAGAGLKGGDSSISTVATAYGGGGGGTYDGNPTDTLIGSGGGGGGAGYPGVTTATGQGYAGGSGNNPGGGGGGGSAGAGTNADAGNGGPGTSAYSTQLLAVGYGTSFATAWVLGNATYQTAPSTYLQSPIIGGVAYIAAGGGGNGAGASPGGPGGNGGGGRGDWDDTYITGGTENTGSGGGSSRSNNTATVGRNGGAGLVLVWY